MNDDLQVILLVGQSNMAGRGKLDEVPELTHPDVLMFRENEWVPAKEPLHTDKPRIAGVGLGMSFAVDLAEATGKSVGVVPCAVGGTPLSRWMPGGDLYENAMSTVKSALGPGRLAAVLWHQGEGDSGTDGDSHSYGERFQTMVRALRAELNTPEIPVIAGELGPFLARRDDCTYYDRVNGHFRDLESIIQNYACARADGLGDNGDDLHFNSESLREFGHRYFKRYEAMMEKNR